VTTFGIVVAAGSGERFGRPKAHIELAGIPLWQRARDLLMSGGCSSVVVVGDVPGGIPGGARRRDSVAAGLATAPEGTRYVLVHDAARPLASVDLVRRVLARLQVGDAGAVVPAVAVADTIKRVAGDLVTETVDRADLMAIQTPQGFGVEVLRTAHAHDPSDASDDALLVERSGGIVAVVPGEAQNLKITYPGDLAVAEALLI